MFLTLLFLVAIPTSLFAMPITSITTVEADNNVSFTVNFSSLPNFFTTDNLDRQQDSFQLYIFSQPATPATISQLFLNDQVQSVIRGEEIHVGAGLPVMNWPTVSNPVFTLRQETPFTLNGSTLSFNTTLDVLNLSTPSFGYGVEVYEFGQQSNAWYFCDSSQPCGLPEPSTFSLLLTVAALAFAWKRAA